jgi:hypothetical protein
MVVGEQQSPLLGLRDRTSLLWVTSCMCSLHRELPVATKLS